MALITRIRPQAGDAAITDIVTAGTFTGTGATLVDVGAEKAWNIPSGSTYNLSVPNKFVDSATDAQGVTFAVRFRVNNVGTGSFDQMFGMYSGGRGPIITKSGSSNMRGKTDTSGGAVLTAVTSGITFLAQTQTLVYRINTVAAGSDTGGLWIGGASRTGNLPNVSAGTGNIGSSVTISNALITALNSTNYDLLDFVYFDEELTDADCASLADDIVAFFGGGGPTTITFNGTIPNQQFTNGQSVNLDLSSYFSGTQTPFTASSIGTELSTVGLSLGTNFIITGTYNGSTLNGVQVRGTDNDLNTADSNTFNISLASTDVNVNIVDVLPSLTSTLSMTFIPSGVGTITISNWANNTGTPLPNLTGITLNVRSLVDGSTVYRTTTASTNGSADCVVSDAAIVTGTEYEVTALKFNGVDYDIGIAIITAT